MSVDSMSSNYIAVRIFAQDHYMHKVRSQNLPLNSKDQQQKLDQNTQSRSFKLKMNNLDICYSDFMKREITRVPIFRVFGSTKRGQTVCVNFHNYFPYLFIEYPLLLLEDKEPRLFLFEFAETLENVFNNEKKNIYGYHSESESVFLKISIYDPSNLKQLREVLWSGLVFGYRFQSYEAHIEYSMHFFTDCDLYGMDFIKLREFTFRKGGIPQLNKAQMQRKTVFADNFLHHLTQKPQCFYETYDFLQEDIDLKLFDLDTVIEERKACNMQLFNEYEKNTGCSIEIDADINCIINKLEQEIHYMEYQNSPGNDLMSTIKPSLPLARKEEDKFNESIYKNNLKTPNRTKESQSISLKSLDLCLDTSIEKASIFIVDGSDLNLAMKSLRSKTLKKIEQIIEASESFVIDDISIDISDLDLKGLLSRQSSKSKFLKTKSIKRFDNSLLLSSSCNKQINRFEDTSIGKLIKTDFLKTDKSKQNKNKIENQIKEELDFQTPNLSKLSFTEIKSRRGSFYLISTLYKK